MQNEAIQSPKQSAQDSPALDSAQSPRAECGKLWEAIGVPGIPAISVGPAGFSHYWEGWADHFTRRVILS